MRRRVAGTTVLVSCAIAAVAAPVASGSGHGYGKLAFTGAFKGTYVLKEKMQCAGADLYAHNPQKSIYPNIEVYGEHGRSGKVNLARTQGYEVIVYKGSDGGWSSGLSYGRHEGSGTLTFTRSGLSGHLSTEMVALDSGLGKIHVTAKWNCAAPAGS